MDRRDIIKMVYTIPYRIGHKVGFTKLNELNNKWILEMIKGEGDYTLQAHRKSYKTTCVSLALAILITFEPRKKIFFMRKTDADVKEIIEQVKKILMHPFFQGLVISVYGVPLKITRSNMGEISTNLSIDVKGTSQLVAQGIGGSLTGKHYDLIFTDDIINLQDRISKAERDRTKLIVYELMNIKNRGGRQFNTGTPWHKEDAFTIMPNIHKWDCYSTGIMSQEEIEETKRNMIPSLFSANYELKHIADEDALFKDPKYFDDSSLLENGFCHIDASYGGGDYTAFTIGRKKGDKIYILGKLWHSHVDNVIPKILELKQKYLTGATYCEDNGDKGYLKKTLKGFGDNAKSYTENTNKYIKISSILYRNWDNIEFSRESDEEYINQILDYTENAEHDDAPDSCASLIRILTKRAETDEPYTSIF